MNELRKLVITEDVNEIEKSTIIVDDILRIYNTNDIIEKTIIVYKIGSLLLDYEFLALSTIEHLIVYCNQKKLYNDKKKRINKKHLEKLIINYMKIFYYETKFSSDDKIDLFRYYELRVRGSSFGYQVKEEVQDVLKNIIVPFGEIGFNINDYILVIEGIANRIGNLLKSHLNFLYFAYRDKIDYKAVIRESFSLILRKIFTIKKKKIFKILPQINKNAIEGIIEFSSDRIDDLTEKNLAKNAILIMKNSDSYMFLEPLNFLWRAIPRLESKLKQRDSKDEKKFLNKVEKSRSNWIENKTYDVLKSVFEENTYKNVFYEHLDKKYEIDLICFFEDTVLIIENKSFYKNARIDNYLKIKDDLKKIIIKSYEQADRLRTILKSNMKKQIIFYYDEKFDKEAFRFKTNSKMNVINISVTNEDLNYISNYVDETVMEIFGKEYTNYLSFSIHNLEMICSVLENKFYVIDYFYKRITSIMTKNLMTMDEIDMIYNYLNYRLVDIPHNLNSLNYRSDKFTSQLNEYLTFKKIRRPRINIDYLWKELLEKIIDSNLDRKLNLFLYMMTFRNDEIKNITELIINHQLIAYDNVVFSDNNEFLVVFHDTRNINNKTELDRFRQKYKYIYIINTIVENRVIPTFKIEES